MPENDKKYLRCMRMLAIDVNRCCAVSHYILLQNYTNMIPFL